MDKLIFEQVLKIIDLLFRKLGSEIVNQPDVADECTKYIRFNFGFPLCISPMIWKTANSS